jgi:hypothetical protein
MENLNERAVNYAAEKTNELIVKAIAQAYADGYRDGYDDAENKGDSVRCNNVEVFDMGLPSKTWWSLKYLEDEEEDTKYLSYSDALKLGLPTLEQVEELIDRCRWQGSWSSSRLTFYGADCQGASGKIIEFLSFGYKEGERLVGVPHYGGGIAYFWIQDDEEGDEKNAIKIFDVEDGKPKMEIVKLFSGYKLPVMIVRKK